MTPKPHWSSGWRSGKKSRCSSGAALAVPLWQRCLGKTTGLLVSTGGDKVLYQRPNDQNEHECPDQAADNKVNRLAGLKIAGSIFTRLNTKQAGGNTLRYLQLGGASSSRLCIV